MKRMPRFRVLTLGLAILAMAMISACAVMISDSVPSHSAVKSGYGS